LISAGEADSQLCFSIADSGLGIRPEEQDHLFEKFYRGKSSEGLAPGSGLGLAICRQIVEAHGGDIQVTSEMGVGSTFTVKLPARK
jgi:signal transduction histidine kinase